MREDRAFEEKDFYQMYQDEMDCIIPCTEDEMEELSEELLSGNERAKKRLIEGCLAMAAELSEEYRDRGLPAGDLVQEANMALLLLVSEYEGGISGHRRRNVSARLWRLPLIFRIQSRKSRRRCLRE